MYLDFLIAYFKSHVFPYPYLSEFLRSLVVVSCITLSDGDEVAWDQTELCAWEPFADG